MKNFTLSLIAIFTLFLATNVYAQDGTTYSDDFSAEIDYLSAGVDGTIWEGILLNNGIWDAGETVAELSALNTTDDAGALTFTTTYSAWAWGQDYGAALYRTVKDGADFEAQVKIVDGQFISLGYDRCDYLMSGIIAKVANDTTFILVQAFDVSEWTAVYGVRDIVPADGLEQENWVDVFDGFTVAEYPYQKLEKYQNTFTGYYSADGMIWEEIYSVDKPEFEGKDIQVGLYSATYTEIEGRVVFDDFILIDYNENVGVDAVESSKLKAFYSNGVINVSNTSAIGNVKLYGVDGSLKYTNLNVNASALSIPVQQKGVYIISCENAGQVYSQKVLAY